MTVDETRGQKRPRATEEELQSRLVAYYNKAKRKHLISLPLESGNDQDIVIICCPFDGCNSGLGKKDPVIHSLIVNSRDKTTSAPLTFASNEQREKVTRHLRKCHKEWYFSPIRVEHLHAGCTEVHDDREEGPSLGNIEEEEEEEIEEETEEEETEEKHQQEEEDMTITRDLDEITETEYRLPNKPCVTAKDLAKYGHIPIGGGTAPGCQDVALNAKKLSIWVQDMRVDYNLPRECVEKILTGYAFACGGKKEERFIIPRTVPLLDAMLKTPTIQSTSVHVCHCCHEYPPIEPEKSDEQKKQETCPHCRLNRYDVVHGRLQPKMMMHYLGVRNQIEELFRDRTFREYRTKGRAEADGIYKSKSITEDLHSIVPEVLEENRSIYSIVIDGAQPFKKRDHSSTQIDMRCEDLPLSQRCKASYSKTLAIIRGPKEPSDLNPYLCVIAREFNDLMEKGMKVTYKNDDGKEEEIIHYPIFRFIYGDAKAMEKTYQYVSCTAKNGCRFCTQIASQYTVTKNDGNKITFSRMTGFTSDAAFVTPGEEDTFIHLTRTPDAEIPRYSTAQTWEILNAIKEACQKRISGDDPDGRMLRNLKLKYGWKGFPKVFEVSKTLDIVDSTPLPIYHNLLLGIVTNFVQYIYDGLKESKTQLSQNNEGRKMKMVISKKELEELEKGIFINCSMKKPYSRLELCYSWISEEVGNFLKVHSPLLFTSKALGRRVISEEAERAWHLLREVVLYYLGEPTDERLDMNSAYARLLEFAKLCEEENIPALVRPNLHTAVCRLRGQQKALGHPKHQGELWFERAPRILSTVNGISHKELSVPKLYVLQNAINKAKHEEGMSLGECAIPKYQPRKNMPKKFTTLCDLDGENYHESGYSLRFKGPGTEITLGARLNTGRDPITRKMGKLWDTKKTLPGKSKLGQDEFKQSYAAIQFKSMVKETTDWAMLREVKSKSKSTERKRKSYIVEVPYQVTDQETGETTTSTELAEIDIFFMTARVERSERGELVNIAGEQQRFALCHLLRTKKENGFYILEYKSWQCIYLKQNLIIPLDDIGNNVNGIVTPPQTNQSGEVIERIVFKPHHTD